MMKIEPSRELQVLIGPLGPRAMGTQTPSPEGHRRVVSVITIFATVSVALLGLVFTAAGGLVLHIAWRTAAEQRAFLARAVRTEGVVARVELVFSDPPTDSSASGTSEVPVVHFVTPGHEAVEFKPNVALPRSPYREGDAVPVLYLPDDPSRAAIDTVTYLGSPSGFATVLGYAFLGFGLGALVVAATLPFLVRRLPLSAQGPG